jgi:hypothetical protein
MESPTDPVLTTGMGRAFHVDATCSAFQQARTNSRNAGREIHEPMYMPRREALATKPPKHPCKWCWKNRR